MYVFKKINIIIIIIIITKVLITAGIIRLWDVF